MGQAATAENGEKCISCSVIGNFRAIEAAGVGQMQGQVRDILVYLCATIEEVARVATLHSHTRLEAGWGTLEACGPIQSPISNLQSPMVQRTGPTVAPSIKSATEMLLLRELLPLTSRSAQRTAPRSSGSLSQSK